MMNRYNSRVGEYFSRPVSAGGSDLAGTAGSVQEGARVLVEAGLAAGQLENVSFRIFGCPHIIALAHRAQELLEGAPAAMLRDLPLEELAQEFDFPVEKTGKLLIMKDALEAAWASGGNTATAD
ncbi:MAG: iron-sulfur cluster assembly scaffold protein [Gammaproteobacteria bacterium]